MYIEIHDELFLRQSPAFKDKEYMNQLDYKTDFLFQYNHCAKPAANDYIFIYRADEVLTVFKQVPTIASLFNEKISLNLLSEYLFCFGTINQMQCFCLKSAIDPKYYEPHDTTLLKTNSASFTSAQFQAAILANHLTHWLFNHHYCGCCGSATVTCDNEMALRCTNSACHKIIYPHIAPVVMGLIYKDRQILLAKHCYAKQQIYSCLAGFVAPGENLENALKREVNEEVGLQIDNIQYVASQPWPFPNVLMIGFTARYSAGVIKIDYKELEDAAWYDVDAVDQMPLLPSKMSLARYLIDMFIRRDLG